KWPQENAGVAETRMTSGAVNCGNSTTFTAAGTSSTCHAGSRGAGRGAINATTSPAVHIMWRIDADCRLNMAEQIAATATISDDLIVKSIIAALLSSPFRSALPAARVPDPKASPLRFQAGC